MTGLRTVIFALLVSFFFADGLLAQQTFNRKPIEYQNAAVNDAVHQLGQAIESGDVQLTWDEKLGWLPAVLDQLGVPESSQTLVFSKTSLQRRQISPHSPRALYFNDDVYVGYVRHGEHLELSAVDPHLGAVFYTINQKDPERPQVVRDSQQCLSCHATQRTQNVPGYLVRSVFPDNRGEPRFELGTITTDHTTPLAERFGGWYVTGRHGGIRHRGNQIADPEADPPIDSKAGANHETLSEFIRTDQYLQPGSDLVALMVLEHQSQMHNLITKAAYETRIGNYFDEAMNRIAERPAGTLSDSTKRRIASAGEALLEFLLFSGEAELASPIEGLSTFTTDFAAIGPRDSQGRSLRDFDLETRLFKYPCSFLIYSDSIDVLPSAMRDYLRRRLTEVLTGEDDSPAFSHLSADDRQAILTILRETKPDRVL